MNKMQAWNGVFGFSKYRGAVSPDYTVFKPIESVDARFYAYLFSCVHLINEFRKCSKGIGTAFLRLYTEDFGNISVPLPPLPTQKAIANFLDRKTAAIDALIEKKEKLPKLLAEKRSALINQAVTKGLDPNVPMKDSGIPWIGEIPAHWEIIPLGYRVSMQGGSTPSKQDERFWGGDIPWVSPKDMKRFEIDDTIDKLTSDALEATSIRLIEPGATLVVVRGMILARKLPVGLSVVPCTINQDMKA
ncbi:MAG: restriction endonuclease subunit S, partial [Vulcanimicrobiota bacterium]